MKVTSNSFNNILKSIGAIAALPLTIFALIKAVVDDPVMMLVVALLTAILASIFVITQWKVKIEGVIIAWLILIVIILGFFVIWPTTMTVEGTVRYTTGDPIKGEKIVLFDVYGVSHETQTNEMGYYRFEKVPNGQYKVSLRENEVEGAAGGILVRRLSTNLIIPVPTSTPIPIPSPTQTVTALSTSTLLPTATPVPGDFEASDEGWGNYPENELPKPSENVSRYCDNALPISHTGDCSLKYQPLQITSGNAYVARFSNASDVKSVISIWVYVPSRELCSGNICSTARVIIWDNQYESHEGEFVPLNHLGEWIEITLDLSGTNYPQPYQAIGVHFYFATEYSGPLYIDTVTMTKP